MPTTKEIADDVVALCKAGQFDAPSPKHFSDDVVSIEPMEGDMARLEGRAAVLGKGEWWAANHEIHEFLVEGPYVNGDQFVVRYKMEVTPKGGARQSFDEVGVYKVRDGKIVEESFFYAS